jgi:hypothetical protein
VPTQLARLRLVTSSASANSAKQRITAIREIGKVAAISPQWPARPQQAQHAPTGRSGQRTPQQRCLGLQRPVALQDRSHTCNAKVT